MAIRRPGPLFWQRLHLRSLSMGVLLVCLIAYRFRHPLHDPAAIRYDSPGPYLVQRVVDGDTLLLAAGARVRLLGVNTPETKHPHRPVDPLGLEAADFTRRHVEGRRVSLKFDRERRDAYHRILAYVFVDDWFLNEQLILAGYSRAETRFPYSESMKRRFRKAEQQAREAKRGMWAK